jgi:hypothetical protein
MTSPDPSKAAGSGESRRSPLGRALRRVFPHGWWKILLACAAVTAALAFLTEWRAGHEYESASLVRVEPARTDLFGAGIDRGQFDHFLQTQVELIRSPSVLSGALAADPKVGSTALLRGVSDPEAELRARLKVGILPGTYLIRVSILTPEPRDGPLIINGVIRKYREVATAWSSAKNEHQIRRLEEYSAGLHARIKEKEKQWIELARKPDVDRPPGAGLQVVSIEEYRQVRQRLFELNLKLIETEALLQHREAEVRARAAGVDPEILFQQRVKDALRKDPEIAALMVEIDELQRKVELAAARARSQADPSRVQMSQQLQEMKTQLRDLVDRKREELVAQGVHEDSSLHDLNVELDSLRVLKSCYEKLLPQLRPPQEQEGADEVRRTLVREDLAKLREMRDAVEKQIEQLRFDSQGEARITEIDPARPNPTPIQRPWQRWFAPR